METTLSSPRHSTEISAILESSWYLMVAVRGARRADGVEWARGGTCCGQGSELNVLVHTAEGGLSRRQGRGPQGGEGEADPGGGAMGTTETQRL